MKIFWFVFICGFTCLTQTTESYVLTNPEFIEPIKNISSPLGGNVEFSCRIKNVGNHRVLWLKRENGTGIFIAVNELKITKNPRITLSLMQKSKDVTESNMYIYAVEPADMGEYECAINTNPTISTIGTLEELHEEVKVKYEVIHMDKNSLNPAIRHSKLGGLNHGETVELLMPSDQVQIVQIVQNASEKMITINDSQIVCFDLPKIWATAKQNVNEMVSFFTRSFKKLKSQFLDE